MNFLELQFELRGKTLPSDHGYALYSAVKRLLQEREDDESIPKDLPADIHLSSIPGIAIESGVIYLSQRSRFRLRCPADRVQIWYRLLQNQVFDIRGHLIRLVQPKILLPEPSECLIARLVTFKLDTIANADLPFYFRESCQKGLEKIEVNGNASISSKPNGDLSRKVLQIKGKKVVGYGVMVEGLSDEDSIKLQCLGLGGRKHFGCGWFYPVSEVADEF
jgi:CRISPR-associated protein Cas6